MENFNSKCIRFRTEISNDSQSLEEHLQQIISSYDFHDVDQWIKAHCVCVVAANIGYKNALLFEVFDKLNSKSYSIHSSMKFSDADYALWFDDVKILNDLFISYGFSVSYCYQAEHYSQGRIGFLNEELAREYILEGVTKNDLRCKTLLAYHTFYGTLGFVLDQDVAIKNLNQYYIDSKDSKIGLVLLNILFRQCTNAEQGWEVIESFSILLNQNIGLYVKADYFLKNNQNQQALDCLLMGIEHDSYYCSYLFGMNILNGNFTEFGYGLEQARQHLNLAFDYGIVYAGFVLGLSYLREDQPGQGDLDLSIQWLEIAAEYNSAEAIIELSKLYLYGEEFTSNSLVQTRALELLEYLVEQEDSIAMVELATYYLEGQQDVDYTTKAKSLLEMAANLDNSFAVYRIGYGFEIAEFSDEVDNDMAFSYYKRAADMGDFYGIQQVARFLRIGLGTEINFEKSIYYNKIGIEEFNSDFCRVELALVYLEDEDIVYNVPIAISLLEQALENGYVYASIHLANVYDNELLNEANDEKAIEYYSRANEADLVEGTYGLAFCYLHGKGVKLDFDKALELYLRAEQLGSYEAKVDIGIMYENGGEFFEVNYVRAFDYMLQAAEYGISFAQYKVGIYYLEGIGIEQDFKQALLWLERALENDLIIAATALGDMYLYDYVADAEFNKAFDYYEFAAQNNCVVVGYGVCFQYGVGVEKDEKRAVDIYKGTLEEGHIGAAYRLGQCYFYGIGTEVNYSSAFDYFSQSVEAGNTMSAGFIGNMYLKGLGVEVDAEQGVEFLSIAAHDNDGHAQYELGNCYLKGEGVEQSDEQALFWYQQSAANGNEAAQKIVGGPRRRRK